jgi:hypothetical protein
MSNQTKLAVVGQQLARKYELSQGVHELFEEAKKEPYRSINAKRGTSVEYFEQLFPFVDASLQRFEQEIALVTTSSWQGKRLDECRKWGSSLRTFLADHLDGLYFANFDQENDAAIIPVENYEFLDGEHLHCSTMPHYTIIRPAHIDVGKHLIQLGIIESCNQFQGNLETLINRIKKEGDKNMKREIKFMDKSLKEIIGKFKLVYLSAGDVIHSLASQYFEIEMFMENPDVMRQFRIPVEFPPAFEITYLLKNIAPQAYMPFEGGCKEKPSLIEENLKYIDLPQLKAECIESTKKHLRTLAAMHDLFKLDFSTRNQTLLAKSGEIIHEGLKEAGTSSPFVYLDNHINKRKKKK